MQDLADQRPDEVLVGGDLVGRGPQGHDVVRAIAARGWRSVQGNHEDFLIRIRCQQLTPKDLSPATWPALQFMAEQLSTEDLEFTQALPFSLTSELSREVCLVHGSPSSFTQGIGHWTDRQQLQGHWGAVEASVLVCAHTHRAIHLRVDGGHVINTGSVGLPFNGDTRAQYLLLDIEGRALRHTFRQLDYDRDAFLRIYESSGFLNTGGLYAWLLRCEVETAHSHLVPFLKWCELTGASFDRPSLDAFLGEFVPGESLSAFFGRVRTAVTRQGAR